MTRDQHKATGEHEHSGQGGEGHHEDQTEGEHGESF